MRPSNRFPHPRFSSPRPSSWRSLPKAATAILCLWSLLPTPLAQSASTNWIQSQDGLHLFLPAADNRVSHHYFRPLGTTLRRVLSAEDDARTGTYRIHALANPFLSIVSLFEVVIGQNPSLATTYLFLTDPPQTSFSFIASFEGLPPAPIDGSEAVFGLAAEFLVRPTRLKPRSKYQSLEAELRRLVPHWDSRQGYVLLDETGNRQLQGAAAPAPPSVRLVANQPITVSGPRILIGTKPSCIRGVTLSAAHPGHDRRDVRYTLDYVGGRQVIQMMAQAHIKTIRTYLPPEKDLLDACSLLGIKVIVGFTKFDDRNVSSNEKYDLDSNRYLAYINQFKHHPAILLWEFGNEFNLHPEFFNNNINNWYVLLADVAARAKTEDPNHPIATAHGDASDLEAVASMPELDLVGLNSYRGSTLGGITTDWLEISSKPFYLSEFGSLTTNPTQQSRVTVNLWRELTEEINLARILGGVHMTWQDEWWKAGDAALRDPASPEENLGMLTAAREPKLKYFDLQKAFGILEQP